MRRRIETAWAKLNKYYNISDNIAVYKAAVALDPRQKF